MRLNPHYPPVLATTHMQDGIPHYFILSERSDGTFRLDMRSDHPDFEDETFELTPAEAAEWIEHSGGRDW